MKAILAIRFKIQTLKKYFYTKLSIKVQLYS